MSDLDRWIDDPKTSNRLRAALQQYPRPSAIPAEALEALGTALGNASSCCTVHSPASAAPGASLGTAALAKAGLIAVAIGLGGAGWCALRSKTEHAVPVVVASPPVNATPAAVTPASPAEAPALVDQTVEDASRNGDASETTTHPIRVAAATSVARRTPDVPSELERSALRVDIVKPDKSQLQQEAALLEVGRKLLSTDPQRALEQTALHRKRFATPMLGLERDLLEMDALCRLGNTTKAERVANNLLKVQPAGPYAERARALLARANRDKSLEGLKDRGGRANQ